MFPQVTPCLTSPSQLLPTEIHVQCYRAGSVSLPNRHAALSSALTHLIGFAYFEAVLLSPSGWFQLTSHVTSHLSPLHSQAWACTKYICHFSRLPTSDGWRWACCATGGAQECYRSVHSLTKSPSPHGSAPRTFKPVSLPNCKGGTDPLPGSFTLSTCGSCFKALGSDQ